ncbi:MAG TPA: hypothetical protein VKD69_05475 [Vicinamibacterales bacterium]|nr:hypothetical protein [Vicinamibacterales bacterium]
MRRYPLDATMAATTRAARRERGGWARNAAAALRSSASVRDDRASATARATMASANLMMRLAPTIRPASESSLR